MVLLTTSRRAARLAASICAFQPSPASSANTARATSLGHMVAPFCRLLSKSTMACSRARSVELSPALRQAFEQYFTLGQARAHLRRQSILRPHRAQSFGSERTSRTDRPDSRLKRAFSCATCRRPRPTPARSPSWTALLAGNTPRRQCHRRCRHVVTDGALLPLRVLQVD